MTALDELSQALTRLTETATPSIVGIGSRLRGSGVVFADGQVLTNAHNVRGDEVSVTFADGRTATGRLAGIDVDGDLAVIAVDTAGAAPLAWADGDGPSAGSIIFAGAATPGGGARVTFGSISAIERAFRGPGGRQIGGSLEHTAPLAPGSSGGPLLDADAPPDRTEHKSDRRGLLPGASGGQRTPITSRGTLSRGVRGATPAWNRRGSGASRPPPPPVGRAPGA